MKNFTPAMRLAGCMDLGQQEEDDWLNEECGWMKNSPGLYVKYRIEHLIGDVRNTNRVSKENLTQPKIIKKQNHEERLNN